MCVEQSAGSTDDVEPTGAAPQMRGGRSRLCAVLIARLTFNGTFTEAGTVSYRLGSARSRAEESAKAC